MNPASPSLLKRAVNGAAAAALAVFVLASYWPTVRLFDLSLADIGVHGRWIGGYAKEVIGVAAGGAAERAGVRAGDVLEFDPRRDADWVLAGYREMPEGFRGALPLRRADGTRTTVEFAPERVAYLPTINDRLALLARLGALTIMIVIGSFLVWARPSLMTWSLLLSIAALPPGRQYLRYLYAFVADEPRLATLAAAPLYSLTFSAAFLVFGLAFPRDSLADRPPWLRALVSGVVAASAGYIAVIVSSFAPFDRDVLSRGEAIAVFGSGMIYVAAAVAALAQTYRKADGPSRARLRWALLGMSAALVGIVAATFLSLAARFVVSYSLSGSSLTPANWVVAASVGFFFPVALIYAVLRQRVVDIQFVVSRTLVYGALSTLALVIMAALHWLLGRLIEQSHLTMGLEGLAAIGLGLLLHRATHSTNLLVDRLVFSAHHAAEQRLRRVIAALPYANDERAIAEAVVHEPVRQLRLASAALFFREVPDGPLRRVLASGWDGHHAVALEPDSMLVRYLQAEHGPLRLDDSHWLPSEVPDGAALPVLAIPLVLRHALNAVLLYGAHIDSTLPDPDEVNLLRSLAEAAATSYQHVRIATLTRELEAQKQRGDRLEATLAELRALVQGGVVPRQHLAVIDAGLPGATEAAPRR
jgi:hypothetical protein